ncbi:MAG: hypothetical protein WBD50_00295 [Candidatus Rhabdochlamydia sp.]
MGGAFSAARKASNKAGKAMDNVGNTMPEIKETLNTVDVFISNLDGIPGRLTTTIEEVGENIVSTSASVANVAKIGAGVAAFKCFSDFCNSWYQTIKLTGIANDARNDLKKLADNTSKTEDEIVNVLKNTRGDLKSSVSQFTEDAHKMGQNFGHMTESLSQSSAKISGAVNQASQNFGYMTHITSDFLAYLSQDIHQTSRCFRVTCFSLTTSALVATMTYLQNSSCDRDPESMLCTAPLKSIAATTIVAGFVALKILMPNRIQHQINDNFLITEEGIGQNVEWTQEELDSIKATNFDVFSFIETKRQVGDKWDKNELEWLLSQDKNIFLKVLLGEAYTTSDCLSNDKLNF